MSSIQDVITYPNTVTPCPLCDTLCRADADSLCVGHMLLVRWLCFVTDANRPTLSYNGRRPDQKRVVLSLQVESFSEEIGSKVESHASTGVWLLCLSRPPGQLNAKDSTEHRDLRIHQSLIYYLISPGAWTVKLPHESFFHPISGRIVSEDTGFLAGRLGSTTRFSGIQNLLEDPTMGLRNYRYSKRLIRRNGLRLHVCVPVSWDWFPTPPRLDLETMPPDHWNVLSTSRTPENSSSAEVGGNSGISCPRCLREVLSILDLAYGFCRDCYLGGRHLSGNCCGL